MFMSGVQKFDVFLQPCMIQSYSPSCHDTFDTYGKFAPGATFHYKISWCTLESRMFSGFIFCFIFYFLCNTKGPKCQYLYVFVYFR